MNKDQIMSLVRAAAVALVSYGTAKGWWGADVAADIISFIAAGAVVVWGILSKTDAKTVQKAAELVPIASSDQRAVGVPDQKITAPADSALTQSKQV